jgi:small subunit ribosomal protein S1
MKKNAKNASNVNAELEALIKDIPAPKIFKKADIIEGIIVALNSGEMIVDVGGRTEGIVSGKELKLQGKKMTKVVGDKVLVYVVKPENEEGQIELSVRRTGTALKWHELDQAKLNEKVIDVKVIEANTGGVIVEIDEGLRGFVPSSQLKNNRIFTTTSFSNKEEASKALQTKLAELIGQTMQVKVMEIDKEKNKVILSEKSVYSDTDMTQRTNTLASIKVGDTLEGIVTGIAPFGLFVNAQGLEGLVHLSEISWDKVSNPSDFYKVDDKVKVQVIGLQDNGKRVAYSIKRLQSDPWKDIVQKYKIGQIVEGEIKSIAQYGAFVRIEDGLNGLIHISELSNKLVKNPNSVVNVGDKVKVMIISMSNEDRHLGLSLKKAQAPTKTAATKDEDSGANEMKQLDKLLSETE